MAKKLNQQDLLKLSSINTPPTDSVAFGAKTDGLYQKVGTVESKLSTTAELLDRVKTPVPSEAKFTDTVVDISGKVDKITGKGLSTNDYTSTEKTKLNGIATNANNYSLPTATSAVLGGIKVGSRLTISSGTLSANVQSTNNFTNAYKTKLDGIAEGANNYSHPTGIYMSSEERTKLAGIDASANNYSLPTASGTVLGGIKVGTRLSITNGVLSATQQTDNNFTNTLKSKLDGIASNANNYSHPTGAGNNHIPSGGAAGQFLKWSASGVAVWAADNDTKYIEATTSANGLMSSGDKTKLNGIATGANKYSHPTTPGNKHIPSGGATNQILRYSESGTAVWSAEKNTTYGAVTTSANGLMIAADKVKLNGIEEGANKYSHPTAHPISFITGLQGALDLKAPLASPTFTGNVTAPTFVGALTGGDAEVDSLIVNAKTSMYDDLMMYGGDIIAGYVEASSFKGNKVDFGNGFTIEPSGTELVFKYNNVIKQRMLSDGSIVAVGELTAITG